MTEHKDVVITYLKAIGIVLVVLGHSGHDFIVVQRFIYMFHMPLFFIVSGFCFREDYIESPFLFIRKKLKGLWWPYVKYGFVFMLIHMVMLKLNLLLGIYDDFAFSREIYSIKEINVKVFKSLFFLYTEDWVGVFWFLKSLFWGSIISCLLLKVFRMCKQGVLLVLIILSLIIFMDNILKKPIPIFNLASREFLAALLFIIGYCFKRYQIREFNVYFMLLSIAITWCGSFFWYMELGWWYYDNIIILPYILTSILLVWSLYSFLSKIRINNHLSCLLNFIGANSLNFMIWHTFTFKMVSIFICLYYGTTLGPLELNPIDYNYAANGWWILYFLFSLIFISGWIYLRSILCAKISVIRKKIVM